MDHSYFGDGLYNPSPALCTWTVIVYMYVYMYTCIERTKYLYFKGHFNCITELLARDGKWKYFINLSADDFPVKTSIEMASNLKELYPNSWTESTPITDENGLHRYEYVHKISKNWSSIQWNEAPFEMKSTGIWSHVLDTRWQ